MTGLFNDDEVSDVLSAVISDMAPELLEDVTLMDRLTFLAIEKIDAFLSTKTFGELLKLLGMFD